MHTPRSLARALATAFLVGPWNEADLTERGRRLVGRRRRWVAPLAQRIVAEYAGQARPTRAQLIDAIQADRGFRRVISRDDDKISVPHGLEHTFDEWVPEMEPCAGQPATWSLPPLTTPAELAVWLHLRQGELDWLADVQARGPRGGSESLSHYRQVWIAKHRGPPRLLEMPKPRLKFVQRRLLKELVSRIPPHAAAHGFRPDHNTLSFVAPHLGQQVVLRMDLRDFFPSIRRARVRGVFQTAGYPEAVARLLAGLCTTATPGHVMDQLADGAGPPGDHGHDYTLQRALDRGTIDSLRRQYTARHLPQGAPTSPALANLCAYRMDCRLTGLAAAAGAHYTRYADDLLFSGDATFARSVRRFQIHAAAIALDEGFQVQHRKTRVMRQGVRQHAAGIILNERPNLPRAQYDRLKAILTNCLRHGPAGQNRENRADFRSHLMGRVAYVASIHPGRGARLSALLGQIAW